MLPLPEQGRYAPEGVTAGMSSADCHVAEAGVDDSNGEQMSAAENSEADFTVYPVL